MESHQIILLQNEQKAIFNEQFKKMKVKVKVKQSAPEWFIWWLLSIKNVPLLYGENNIQKLIRCSQKQQKKYGNEYNFSIISSFIDSAQDDKFQFVEQRAVKNQNIVSCISHINFTLLRKISIFKVMNIEPLTWIDSPMIERIFLQVSNNNEMLNMKSVQKINFRNLKNLTLKGIGLSSNTMSSLATEIVIWFRLFLIFENPNCNKNISYREDLNIGFQNLKLNSLQYFCLARLQFSVQQNKSSLLVQTSILKQDLLLKNIMKVKASIIKIFYGGPLDINSVYVRIK